MNTVKKSVMATAAVLSLALIGNTANAVTQTGMAKPINDTIGHLKGAQNAMNTNDLKAAEAHLNAARQSAKEIIGGTLEADAALGSSTIVMARRHLREGDTENAATAISEAIEVFKAMLDPRKGGGRGGLR